MNVALARIVVATCLKPVGMALMASGAFRYETGNLSTLVRAVFGADAMPQMLAGTTLPYKKGFADFELGSGAR